MIDLQGCLNSLKMVKDASEATSDALRIDAAKYVDRRDFRLAQMAIEIATISEELARVVQEGEARLALID